MHGLKTCSHCGGNDNTVATSGGIHMVTEGHLTSHSLPGLVVSSTKKNKHKLDINLCV